MFKKIKDRSKSIGLYNNLSSRKSRRSSGAKTSSQKRTAYLASLPKNPVKRFLYRVHPKRVGQYIFSKQGALTLLKLGGVGLIALALMTAALFALFRKELDALRPEEIAKRVQSTVTKYYDRNGQLLWEDRGNGNYTLVIDSKDIPKVMKEATIALEDKDFYKHKGISVSGLVRATINNFRGGEVQGASTLTQQLIKNVFFQQDAQENRLSVSRKVKEIILALEVERMYNKDQIVTMYLNEVPYGGPRNGVESAARAYFGKPAKNLTLAEAALIASIPQNPTYYNPYNIAGNKDLIARQQYTLDKMEEQGYASAEDVEKAKKYPILDKIKPESSSLANIKAPHFVLQVREELEKELGTKVVRGGGLTIKTTLDYRVQKLAEQAVQKHKGYVFGNGSDNIALTAIDSQTGQIMAMIGSHDFRNESYGSVNAATSMLQPGSSIKPFVFANLFKERDGQNWGAGSLLYDDPLPQSIYKTANGRSLQNFDNRFYGRMTVREGLANSRNTTAVKAAYVTGIDSVIKTAREAGDRSFCTQEVYGLSAAIGSCNLRQVEHVNAFATFARQGVYKPEAYTLEVKDSTGKVLKQWKDDSSKRVMDPQVSYLISDILSDPRARQRVFGPSPVGFSPSGVKTATKTGTTDDGNGHVKDNWTMTYSPKLSVGIWSGRHDGRPLNYYNSTGNGLIIDDFVGKAHRDVFAKDGTWKSGDWFQRPAGIQTLFLNGRNDIYPSWFKKSKSAKQEKMNFDRVSKRKATSCTPSKARISLTVETFEDPVTKQKSVVAPDGYNAKENDNVHKCSDASPTVSLDVDKVGDDEYEITATVIKGTHPLSSLEISVGGQVISNQAISNSGSYSITHKFSGSSSVSVTVIDKMYYTGTDSDSVTVAHNGNGNRRNRFFGF